MKKVKILLLVLQACQSLSLEKKKSKSSQKPNPNSPPQAQVQSSSKPAPPSSPSPSGSELVLGEAQGGDTALNPINQAEEETLPSQENRDFLMDSSADEIGLFQEQPIQRISNVQEQTPGADLVNGEVNAYAPTESSPVVTLDENELAQSESALKRMPPVPSMSDRQEHVYVVREGDTLWDLSEQFFGDPTWWPRLWQKNQHIQNPHLIYPGMQVVFQPSNGQSAPAIGVVSQIESKMKNEFLKLAREWGKSPGYFISANALKRDERFVEVKGQSVPPSFYVTLRGFGTYETPPAYGRIVRFDGSPHYGQQGGLTYVQFFEDSHNRGDRLLAGRLLPYSYDPSGEFHLGQMQVWIYSGVLRMSRKGGGRYDPIPYGEARVDQVLNPISAGDYLFPFHNLKRLVKSARGGPVARMNSVVIAMGEEATMVAGKGNIVFLSRDPGDSVNLGDEIPLFMPYGGIGGYSDAHPMPWRQVAVGKVIDANPEMIQAVIIESREEVSVGARTWSHDQ